MRPRALPSFNSESVLDLYNLLLAIVLFASPWFFAHASRAAGFDLWLSSAAIIVLSIAAMIAYSSSGVDLTFASGLAASHRAMSNPKLHWKHIFPSGPLILPFANVPAAKRGEWQNRTTSEEWINLALGVWLIVSPA